MGLFNWNSRPGDDELLRALATRVVQGCLNEVLQRSSGLTSDMLPAEARGYIRTRAAKVVNREIAVLCSANHDLHSIDRTRLAALVTDKLLAAVVEQRRYGSRTIAA
jgi:hypothetical protein